MLRAFPKAEVFAQMLAGFELANADSRVVSVNPVQPQEDYTPLKDFELQLRMFAYLHSVYPKVQLSMHAARPNMTQTFRRAVEGYHIGYAGLKTMVRDSLEHAFVPGLGRVCAAARGPAGAGDDGRASVSPRPHDDPQAAVIFVIAAVI